MTTKNAIELDELRTLTKCIFRGFTIPQMAQAMKISKSTVSYKMKKIFKKYNAKTRLEFAINVFSEILDKTKRELEKIKDENTELKKRLTNQVK